jgi:short-subunit dehydrogenase
MREMTDRTTVLVTGASAGIGVELARVFAREGHDLVLVARREERLRDLAAELGKEHGIEARFLALDLTAEGAAERLVRFVQEEGVRVDWLVNNAGFGGFGRFAGQDLDRQRKMIGLNVDALVELTGRFLPAMVERGTGGVMNVASTAAFQAGPLSAIYFATKAFVLSFTEALASETRGTGVRVSALCPGPVRTEFFEVAGFPAGEKPGTMTAERVARTGYRGLMRGKVIVIPGVLNRIGAFLPRLLPRALVRRTLLGYLERQERKTTG